MSWEPVRDAADELRILMSCLEWQCGEAMSDTTAFGQWLKQHRKASDLTQKGLAQQVGCAEITLRKVEAGDLQPSSALAVSLARALGAADDDLPGLRALARGRDDDFDDRARLPRLRRIHNLPAQLTPLIGREQDIAALRRRLLSDDARLVTLAGPPGVGKTRLALAVAEDMACRFEHGVAFVRLGPVSDPALVAAAIAQALGIEMSGPNRPELQLRAWLEQKHLLLVLDNCEHVLAAAPLVDDLLRRGPWLHVLATSRQPLRVRGERQIAVRPLALPSAQSDAGRLTAADALHYSAVALFAERAQAAQFHFAVTDANAGAVAELCRRLDGLPLAIELAATRVRLLPPGELLARLSGPWLLSMDGPCNAPARQQTLRGAIGWSYDLLTPAEQRLLIQLAMFTGGFTLEEAEALCGDREVGRQVGTEAGRQVDTGEGRQVGTVAPGKDAAMSVLDGIASLLDKNLLWREAGPGGEPHYSLFKTVRDFAEERLTVRWGMFNCLQTKSEGSG
jgi:DNA-binding XRE family transcriptional regulator/DNA polymerase III delta prime subunit